MDYPLRLMHEQERSHIPRLLLLALLGAVLLLATGIIAIVVLERSAREPAPAPSPQTTMLTHRLPASGPLTVHADNPRYFSDPEGRVIYLTGSHTWTNLVDYGLSDPPRQFDFTNWLDFLDDYNHNFFRLWAWEQSRWDVYYASENYWFRPQPFVRTGPGNALDGKPRFDLDSLNESYFARLRARVVEARDRGKYVAVMLFNGWSVASQKGGSSGSNPWRGHPFNESNNINGIDGDRNNDNSGEETHELGYAELTAIQEAYVRRVIDAVNDLDNVLYEISNESHSGSNQWQYHMINFIKAYESGLPKQHPVGMTVEYPNGSNNELFNGPADWVSPNGDVNNPPVASGMRVILSDTDHLCGVCGDRSWVWKSFTRGENPVFMDGYDGSDPGAAAAGWDSSDAQWVGARLNMGYTFDYASRANLAAMIPRPSLASSGYCLANPAAEGSEYLVYLPQGTGSVNVDLSASPVRLATEWLRPSNGNSIQGDTIDGGSSRTFTAPFSGDAVLYIRDARGLSVWITSFTGMVGTGNQVTLEWTTASEKDNASFEVQKSVGSQTVFETIPGSNVPAFGSTGQPHDYSFQDPDPIQAVTYYRLKQIDLNSTETYSGPIQVDVPADVEPADLPRRFRLHQNYPNPFNAGTMLNVDLPAATPLRLAVYNALGQKVKTLADGTYGPGNLRLQWDARDDAGKELGSGVYLLTLRAKGLSRSVKMLLVR